MSPPRPLRHVDAAMVLGLPDAPENLQWIRDALAALQQQDPRADVDFGGIEDRLRAIESKLGEVDQLWGAFNALATRMQNLESAYPLEGQVNTAAAALDPLEPANWRTVEVARAALMVKVTQEAARRLGYSVELYTEMVELDKKGARRNEQEDLLYMQHQGWAMERAEVELARLGHQMQIGKLESVEDAWRYPWQDGWPEFSRGAV